MKCFYIWSEVFEFRWNRIALGLQRVEPSLLVWRNAVLKIGDNLARLLACDLEELGVLYVVVDF